MKIIHLSDTHSYKVSVPDGDILIHSGDFSGRGSAKDLLNLNTWFSTLPHKHKLVIPGNHDEFVEKFPDNARNLLTNGLFLVDEQIEIDGIKIYGSPWTPTFGHWSFMHPRKSSILWEKWNRISNNIDILVTHGPPYGILDLCPNGHVGCELLLAKVQQIQPKYHLFGHIHESSGIMTIGNTTFINSSICDGNYQPTQNCHGITLT